MSIFGMMDVNDYPQRSIENEVHISYFGGSPRGQTPRFSFKFSIAYSIDAMDYRFIKYIDNYVFHKLFCQNALSALFFGGGGHPGADPVRFLNDSLQPTVLMPGTSVVANTKTVMPGMNSFAKC